MIITYTKEAALGVLDRANRTRVPPELLVEAIELFAEMPCEEEQSVFDVRTLRLVDFLRAKGFSGRHHADLVVASPSDPSPSRIWFAANP